MKFEPCDCVRANKLNVPRFAEAFSNSVALFELLERGGGPPSVGVFGGVFTIYRIIAARDGAMNLYHFRSTLEAIGKQLPGCSALKSPERQARFASLLHDFDERFPHTENVRHAIAHAGEVFQTPQKMTLHEQRGDHGGSRGQFSRGGFFFEGLYERTYTVSNRGRVFSLNLDNKATMVLDEIAASIAAAFRDPPT